MTADVYRAAMYESLRPFLEARQGVRAFEISGIELRTEFGFQDVREAWYPEIDICNYDTVRPYGTGYGLVFANQVLEHVEAPWVAVENMQKMLKPEGYAVVTTVCLFPPHDMPADYWRFMPRGLEYLFRNYQEVMIGSWGNKSAVKAVFGWQMNNRDKDLYQLAQYNEPDAPIMVWAIARNR
jgi:hypothetical protein